MSTMDNLHRKGWLDRVKEGKAYRYTATASREEYSARLMREALVDGGDTEVVLSHFIAQIGSGESEALRSALSNSAQRNSAPGNSAPGNSALGKLRGRRR
jgi:predicted transcriptional regulator